VGEQRHAIRLMQGEELSPARVQTAQHFASVLHHCIFGPLLVTPALHNPLAMKREGQFIATRW
jgi:hypothetical protein